VFSPGSAGVVHYLVSFIYLLWIPPGWILSEKLFIKTVRVALTVSCYKGVQNEHLVSLVDLWGSSGKTL
jgi:hypothetical protein